ncbi:TrmH family RNA methyltransferase [Saccharicrinis aurantiacus]|uniref:TrmH family RNA methyltransferase n=1 Tax=Saccharicrinis aurantiacus TaxID=1849719 RepID=UPI002493019B|nr:RNA methyltransferase [Saccharicrinis aurantiacus]
MDENINEFLSQYITDNRKELFDRVLNERTKYISVVLEDIYQAHNASAVLRSCDCFGIQDVHIIENTNEYTVSRDVALGSSKWVTMHKYNEHENNTLSAIEKLKADGYRIVATTPHTNDVELYDFDVTKGKAAFVFGTELTGISDIVKQEADEFVKIPMYGFTESFNISVCAALMLQHLSHQIRANDVNWQLSEAERESIKFDWLKSSIKRSEAIVEEYKRRDI